MHVERGVETDAGIIAQFAAQVAKACRTLPPGPEVERLRNFCGRIWELLHTPTYAALERQWLTAGSQHGDLTRFYAEKVYAAIHAMLVEIIEHGIVAIPKSTNPERIAENAAIGFELTSSEVQRLDRFAESRSS